MRTRIATATAALTLGLLGQALSTPDLAALQKLRTMEMNDSQVMKIETYLSDIYGPRLTNSPEMREAAHWAEQEMTSWGLAQVHEETFPFGRGWSNDATSAQALSPRAYPLIAYAKAWTPGTEGDVKAEAEIVSIASAADFDKYRGKLRGKFVLDRPLPKISTVIPDTPAQMDSYLDGDGPKPAPDGTAASGEFVRYTDSDLAAMLHPAAPRERGGGGGAGRGAGRGAGNGVTPAQVMKFYLDEGVACVLEPGSGNSNDGTVFVSQGQGADSGGRGGRGVSLYSADASPTPCQLALANESYGRIYRTLQQQVPVTLDINVRNSYHTENGLDTFNIIAEIPGGDLAQQVVMLGAHFDSWQSATGATDNAAGAAVMMEAMRLLKGSGLPLRRTVRIGLWGGEEEGELGSRAYVRAHFRNADGTLLPEQKLISAYYNMDNGSGAIRGIFLQGNSLVGPIFSEWMKPLQDLGMNTPAARNDGSTDHLSFDSAGIPGFEFVQDELDYFVRTHHSSADTSEHVIPSDMERNAILVASFVYLTANRAELLPRKELPAAGARGGR